MHTSRNYTIVQYRPEPLAIHDYEVVTGIHGFNIVTRAYSESAAQFEKRFQQRLGSPAQVYRIIRKIDKQKGASVIVEDRVAI